MRKHVPTKQQCQNFLAMAFFFFFASALIYYLSHIPRLQTDPKI